MFKKNNNTYTPKRPYQIGEQLPYFEFESDPNSTFYRVHLLKDGALGICWSCPVPASYSVDGGIETTVNELRTFLEGLPTGYEAQIIMTSHNNLMEKMRRYLAANPPIERAQALRQSRAEKLLEAGFGGYAVGEGLRSQLRDTSMVITLRTPDLSGNLGALQSILNAMYQVAAIFSQLLGFQEAQLVGKLLNQIIKESLAEFREVVMSVENTLNQMFHIHRMSLEELKEHYWHTYAPSYKEPNQKAVVDKKMPFNDQVFPLPIENEHQIIKIGDDYFGVVMMAMMPDVVDKDYLGIIRRSLISQHSVFINFTTANQGMERIKLTVGAEFRRRIAGAFNKEEAQAYGQEASQVKTRLFEGRKIMYAMLGVIVHGYSAEQVEDLMLRINANFKKLSVVPDVEKSMALQALSYSFPLAWRNEYSKPFARSRRVLSDDICDLIPIHGHWGGHGQRGTPQEKHLPQAVYVNRDGEITFFDHTAPDFVNWHYAITGTSGSGKSFAVVDLTLQLFSAGVEKQYLMTIKDDYDRFAETMGKLIIIDLDRQDTCINPFTGEITKQRLQQWTTAVELMVQKGEHKTNRIEGRIIEQVVQYAYDIVPDDDVLRPTWIRESFFKFPYADEAQRDAGMQMAEEIGSYCEDGIYGKLFDAPPSISEEDKLVVFNLQNVLNEKISDVIINAIFTMLDNIMYTGNRAEKKHLLVDEMISMISSKGGTAVSNQIKRAFRTYRSLNCMCGISSQNEEDLTTDVGQAIIGNITKRMILKPRREMIPMLMQTLGLKSERHEMNIKSLDTKPGYYSEFYLMSPHGEVICRLLTDKLTYALATTTPDDVAEIQRLREEKGGDWWQATVAFAQKYPHGVRAYRSAQKTV
ncbi:MAG: TraC family protein [Alphaproteobacteria bacterium]